MQEVKEKEEATIGATTSICEAEVAEAAKEKGNAKAKMTVMAAMGKQEMTKERIFVLYAESAAILPHHPFVPSLSTASSSVSSPSPLALLPSHPPLLSLSSFPFPCSLP